MAAFSVWNSGSCAASRPQGRKSTSSQSPGWASAPESLLSAVAALSLPSTAMPRQSGQHLCLLGLAEQGGVQPVALQQRHAARAPWAGVHWHARRAEGVDVAADGALAHFKAARQLARCGAAVRLQII